MQNVIHEDIKSIDSSIARTVDYAALDVIGTEIFVFKDLFRSENLKNFGFAEASATTGTLLKKDLVQQNLFLLPMTYLFTIIRTPRPSRRRFQIQPKLRHPTLRNGVEPATEGVWLG